MLFAFLGMPGKEVRIDDRKIEIDDWTERFEANGKSKTIVSSFRFTIPKQVLVGSRILIEGREGIVESIEPTEACSLSLGAF
jgi:hypothetical protein